MFRPIGTDSHRFSDNLSGNGLNADGKCLVELRKDQPNDDVKFRMFGGSLSIAIRPSPLTGCLPGSV